MKGRRRLPISSDDAHSSALTIGREYVVLGIEADWYRLLNDRDEPVLYDLACFDVIEAAEPADWVSRIEDGVRYAYPLGWARPGFLEDWHDGVDEARIQFATDLAQRYGGRV
jgi:hypothetical protein